MITCTIAAILFAVHGQPPSPAEHVTLRVLTFNIQSELVDFAPNDRQPAWPARQDACVWVLRDADADLVALQEPTERQLAWVMERVPGYQAVAAKPFRGGPAYTDAVLLFKPARFELVEHGQWWLSPTPGVPLSIGFGNGIPRVVVWAVLRDRQAPGEPNIAVFTTHFDNTHPAHIRMARLCQDQFRQNWYQRDLPMLFLGDFNTDHEQGDYATLTSDGWRDAYLASPHASAGGRDNNVPTKENGRRIDHILYRGETWHARSWQRIESPQPGQALSDHWPVLAELSLRVAAPLAAAAVPSTQPQLYKPPQPPASSPRLTVQLLNAGLPKAPAMATLTDVSPSGSTEPGQRIRIRLQLPEGLPAGAEIELDVAVTP